MTLLLFNDLVAHLYEFMISLYHMGVGFVGCPITYCDGFCILNIPFWMLFPYITIDIEYICFTQKLYRALIQTIMNTSIIKSNPKPPKVWHFLEYGQFKIKSKCKILMGCLARPIHTYI
jgi:hypothetical protein